METKHVEALVKKAAQAADSGDAQRFSQAALNAANALAVIFSLNHKDSF